MEAGSFWTRQIGYASTTGLSDSAHPSNPLEILLHLPPGTTQHHRTAVRANRRIRGAAQLLEYVRHLLVRQRVIGFDRRMARRRRGDSLDGRIDAGPAIEAFEVLRQRPQSRGAILASEQR